jgi:S-adenosylmethionine decarboxylase
MHLTIDGFGANSEKLASEELVRGLLDRYPESIGMTKIAPPHVQRYLGTKPEDWGVSGFVLIAESHIAIHTFPERRHVWIDIFSCKAVDTLGALQIAARAFDIEAAEPKIHERGLEYPHAVERAIPVAELERRAVLSAAAGAGERR